MNPVGGMKSKMDTSLKSYRNVFQAEWQMQLRFCVIPTYLSV